MCRGDRPPTRVVTTADRGGCLAFGRVGWFNLTTGPPAINYIERAQRHSAGHVPCEPGRRRSDPHRSVGWCRHPRFRDGSRPLTTPTRRRARKTLILLLIRTLAIAPTSANGSPASKSRHPHGQRRRPSPTRRSRRRRGRPCGPPARSPRPTSRGGQDGAHQQRGVLGA